MTVAGAADTIAETPPKGLLTKKMVINVIAQKYCPEERKKNCEASSSKFALLFGGQVTKTVVEFSEHKVIFLSSTLQLTIYDEPYWC